MITYEQKLFLLSEYINSPYYQKMTRDTGEDMRERIETAQQTCADYHAYFTRDGTMGRDRLARIKQAENTAKDMLGRLTYDRRSKLETELGRI